MGSDLKCVGKYLRQLPWLIWRNFPILLAGTVLLINVKLHTGPDLSDGLATRRDLSRQLAFLERQIHENNLGGRMQKMFPEGFVFVHALYGLAWAELAIAEPSVYGDHGLHEARYAFSQINSDLGRSTFPRDMTPSSGMFYNGWRNYLMAKIVEASGTNPAVEDLQRFRQCSDAVAACFRYSESPFPDSYPDQSWPSDACVGMASLALYNRLVEPQYSDLQQTWVRRIRQCVEKTTGLLPHHTAAVTAQPLEGPRGSSGVLNLYFLPDIDPQFAVEQFVRFDSLFGQSRLGLATIREYPRGTSGMGDVDSGPVVWGVGFAATIVGIGTYLRMGEVTKAQAISDAVESLGFSYSWGGRKRYIWGMLPIADALIAWGRAQRAEAHVMALRKPGGEGRGSVVLFHGVSLMLMGMLFGWRYRGRLKLHFRHKSKGPSTNREPRS